jgi:NuA3 HAT complex component NTO1
LNLKKTALDIKERRRIARRIVKGAQPFIEIAVRAEAEISSKAVDKEIKVMEQLLDSCLQAGNDSISVSLGDGSIGEHDAEQDMEVVGNNSIQANAASGLANGTQETTDPADVDMQDVDAPYEDENTIVAATPADDTIDTGPVTRANKGSPTKANNNKTSNTPPDSNGYMQTPEIVQPAPPTPPVSNGDTNTDADILTNGGIPWYVKDFEPEGTSLVPGKDAMSSFSEELSEMDEDDLRGLGVDVGATVGEAASTVVTASPAKPKKGKSKKKGKGRR